MEIIRSFDHRGGKNRPGFGHIGEVTFTVPKGKYVLNGTELPDASVTHLMTFALQTLQDAYAGSENLAEAKGAFDGKLDKLLKGTIGTRTAGDGADERTRVARSLVQAAYKTKVGAKSPDYVAFTGLSDADQNAKLDAWYAANREAFDPAIDDEMARRAAKREAKTGLAKEVNFAV